MSKENEELIKSIDSIIADLFEEDESVEKSIDIAKDASTTADKVISSAPSTQSDEMRGGGRPKQISDVPMVDEDGKRSKEYDSAISEKAKEEDQEEADQVKEMNQIKEGGRASASKAPEVKPFKKSLTEEEFEEYIALKKAKEESEKEEIKKAQVQQQEELIKSVVERTSKVYEEKIESLTKSLNEQSQLVKAMANKPQRSKSITNIEAVEKSFNSESGETIQKSFTKSEILDAAEELAKSGKISVDNVIELENNGYIFNKDAREAVENYLNKK